MATGKAKGPLMLWGFLQELQTELGEVSDYRMAKLIGVSYYQYQRYADPKVKAKSLPAKAVASLRWHSGLSWEAFGKLYDKHLLPKSIGED